MAPRASAACIFWPDAPLVPCIIPPCGTPHLFYPNPGLGLRPTAGAIQGATAKAALFGLIDRKIPAATFSFNDVSDSGPMI